MATFYTVTVDTPPRGVKAAQTFAAYSKAKERAGELAKAHGIVAAVYETTAEGRAKRGAEPVHICRPPAARPPVRRAAAATPAPEPAAKATPAAKNKPAAAPRAKKGQP